LIIRAAAAEAALAEGVVALAAEAEAVLAVVPAKNLPYTRNIKLID
jgi:hypothetical protein